MLCGARTKKFIANKVFQNYAILVMIIKKEMMRLSKPPTDAQKIGQNPVKPWSRMVFWIV